MTEVRHSTDRGHADHGCEQLPHFPSRTITTALHGLPAARNQRGSRAAGKGFGTHAPRHGIIATFWTVEHKDNLGTGSIIRPGEVQRMSAGAGVTHSELNHSTNSPVHFLQIWILPEKEGLPPSYEQRDFPANERKDRLRLVAARDGRDGAVTIHQDVDLYAALLGPQTNIEHALRPGRHAWLQVARGGLTVNGQDLAEGDGAAISGESSLRIEATAPSEILLFDLA
jgi:redox-sensitive bicupin YhaK (pirin superfamily)